MLRWQCCLHYSLFLPSFETLGSYMLNLSQVKTKAPNKYCERYNGPEAFRTPTHSRPLAEVSIKIEILVKLLLGFVWQEIQKTTDTSM